MHRTVNGTFLNVVERGQGDPALVFLHYFGGSSQAWTPVVERLAPTYRCLFPDLRGFGQSQTGGGKLDLATFADDTDALQQLCEVAGYVLVGHSMGGKIALKVAARRPPGLKGIVLIAPSPPSPEPMTDDERLDQLRSHGERAAAAATVRRIAVRPLAPAVIERCIEDNVGTSPAAWSWWLEEGSRKDIRDEVAGLEPPTLVLCGAADPVIGKKLLDREVMPLLLAGRMHVVEDVGHLVPLEAPGEVAEAIHAFLSFYLHRV